MRDYLYAWHAPESQLLVLSGLEFGDLLPGLADRSGVVLLQHESEVADLDEGSGFGFVAKSDLPQLAGEAINSWGDFVWSDTEVSLPLKLTDQETAELLYFAHKGSPLGSVLIPSLSNKFLAFSHDDGWYLRLLYASWEDAADVMTACIPSSFVLDVAALRSAKHAQWLQGGINAQEEKTFDIDRILNRRLRES